MKKASDLRIPFTWAERRSVLIDRFLYIPGYYEKHSDWEMIPWSDPRLFGNQNQVAVEYCSGNGQWICEKAKQRPDMNWVAVEKRFDRSRKIWARMHRESLSNLIVICGDGLVYARHYAPLSSVAEIFVNFPDPWPKLRHAKHRIIRPEFLDAVEKTLAPSAQATFVTDDLPLASEMIATAMERPLWKPLHPSPHYSTDWAGYGESYFCNLWKGKGRTIHFIQFEVGR